MQTPFLIFSWRRPFLPDLKDFIWRQTDGKPGKALVIVPNQRPWRYFAELFLTQGKALMLPKMLPFEEVAAIWRRAGTTRAVYAANILDQTAILRKIVQELAATDATLAARFADMDMESFLPWGFRLASLLEDIFTQGVEPRNLSAPEGDIEPLAAVLLVSLRQIASRYQAALAAANYTTHGMDCFFAGSHAEAVPAFLMPAPDRPVYIAGFSTLNGTQKKLFHSLWQAGAQICMHGDPDLAVSLDVDSVCADQAAWIKAWSAGVSLVTLTGNNRPQYFFHAAYDGHSQLKAMNADLEQEGDAARESTAIVLQNTGMLLPVLHHLKNKNVNISMGYPLTHTPFHSLVSEISTLLQRKRPQGIFYWRDLQRLFRHPIVGMLAKEEDVGMQRVAGIVDRELRRGGKYVNLTGLEQLCIKELSDEEAVFLRSFLACMIEQPARATTPGKLGKALADICDFLLANGRKIFGRFKLDEEALARARDSTSELLQNNLMADEPFDLQALFALLQMLMEQERIPFEAYPLVGTQVLGMLETRLLHFDELYILDCSDDLLPGKTLQDPLLPDNLRSLLGLPDSRSRQLVAAYNLMRLCQNAKRVHFYWAEGAAPSAVDSGRRERSRYMERLIWEIEQKKGALLKPGEACFAVAQSEAALRPRRPKPLASPAFAQTALPNFFAKSVTASSLNSFMLCPLLFAYKYLLKLEPAPVVSETENAATLGECAHKALEFLLDGQPTEPFTDANLNNLLAQVEPCLSRAMLEAELGKTQPVASCMYFEAAAPRILTAYLQKENRENSGAIVLELEKKIETELAICGKKYKFRGRLDRVDERGDKVIVLDYKTGKPRLVDQSIWQDEEFFASIAVALADAEIMRANAQELLDKLRQYLPDAQLPVYMLLANAADIEADDAAYVNLLDKDGAEARLIDDALERDEALRRCELIVGFVLRCIETRGEFEPNVENCGYCDYASFCGV